MKLLLLKPVNGLGDAGKVVDTKIGYAVNYLIPKKLATTDLEAKIDKKSTKLSPDKLTQLAKKISKTRLNINKSTNEKGVLFSSVSAEEIKDSLEKLFPELISAQHEIRIPVHIKTLGEHKVTVRVSDKDSTLKVNVIDPTKTATGENR
jgi:large subunit ribosomal protein L9